MKIFGGVEWVTSNSCLDFGGQDHDEDPGMSKGFFTIAGQGKLYQEMAEEFLMDFFERWNVSLATKRSFGSDPDHDQDRGIFNGISTTAGQEQEQ